MAEFEAIGKALQIPQSVLNNIDAIDKKINLIASDSEKMATHFMSAMTRMGTGADGLLKKLQSIQGVINSLATVNIGGLGNIGKVMGDSATQAEKAVSSISAATAALNRYGNASARAGQTSTFDRERKEYVERYKMYERMFDQIERVEKRRIAAAQAAERATRAQAREDSRNRRSNYQSYVTSTDGALRTADRANTYQQREQAIKNLEAAMKKLRTTDANYLNDLNRLISAHKRLSEQQRIFVRDMRGVQREQSKLMNTSQQLARSLALMFSVSAITGYINKLISVRGEFELQQTALASILQSKDQADRLFGQITELAVRSPFTLKELTTYTKSLSAYQVEYERLYDTTKMLADVSAGLGVDMQRLILAFGQVKAANFLRGTETRQFTEAGINMLGELAKYYTELEGRIVSVAEVQDRQFKRMISFQDVEEVFKRLTSAGGMFYNMQEKQAETLAGLMSNLQDRIDLMLNDIGKENEDVIKGIIRVLGVLLENWEAIANALKLAGAAFILYKLNVASTSKELIRYAAIQKTTAAGARGQLSVFQLLEVGLLRFSKSIRTAGAAMKAFATSNIWLLALTGIATAIYEIVHWNDEYNKSLEEIKKRHDESTDAINKLAGAYNVLSIRAKQANGAMAGGYDDAQYKEQLDRLQRLDELVKERQLSVEVPIEFVTRDNIDELFADRERTLQQATEFGSMFRQAMERGMTEHDFYGIIGENLEEDLEDLGEAYASIGTDLTLALDGVTADIGKNYQNIGKEAQELYKELEKGPKQSEAQFDWDRRRYAIIQRMRAFIYMENATLANQLGLRNKLWLYGTKLHEVSKAEIEVQHEINRWLDDMIEKYGGLEEFRRRYAENPIAIAAEIEAYWDEKEVSGQVKSLAVRISKERLQIPIDLVPSTQELPTFFNDFRDVVKSIDNIDLFDENELQKLRSLSDLEDSLISKYKNAQDELEVLNRSNTDRLDLSRQINEEMKIANGLVYSQDERNAAQLRLENLQKQKELTEKQRDAEIDRQQRIKETAREVATALNLNYIRPAGSKSDNQAESDLEKQISLIEKAAKEYKDYRNLYDIETSQQKTEKAFRTLFEDLGLNVEMSFEPSGIIEAFKKLLESVGDDEAQVILRKIAEWQTDVDKQLRTDELDEYRDKIDDLFTSLSNYQELEKLGLNKDLISQLFGINVSSINDVQEVFEKIKTELKGYGNEGEKLIADSEKKITDAQQKELQDRMKKYATYLTKQYSEIANIRIKLQKEMSEVDTLNMSDVQKRSIKQRLQDEANKQIQKLTWEDFKASDMYTQMFDDLDKVSTKGLDYMVERLEELKGTLTDLDPTELKEIIKAINDIKEEQLSRNPLKGIGEDVETALNFAKQRKELEEQITDEYEKQKELRKQIPQQEQNVENARNNYGNVAAAFGTDSTQAQEAKKSLELQEETLSDMNKDLSESEKKAKDLKKRYDEGADAANKVAQRTAEFAEKINTAVQSMSTLVDGLNSVFNMSIGFNDVASSLMDFGNNMANTVSSAGSAFASFATGNIFGGITSSISAIGGLFSSIGSLFSIGDKNKERQIQRELELVEDLQYAYNKLEKAIEGAYSFDTLNAAQSGALENINAQIASYEDMIAAERDKKHTDDDRIKEWQHAIDDLHEQRQELQEQILGDLGGFGSDANFKSMAQSFVEAWLDAFKETGDGLSGLQDEFKNFVKNLLVQQAVLALSEAYLQPFREMIDGFLSETSDEGIQLSADELKKIAAEMPNVISNLNGALEQLFANFAQAGIDIQDEADELTGLQQGIQGITESTAQALEALLASIRYFVVDGNTTIHNIYNFLLNPPMESPLMQEMRTQTTHLASIASLLGSVIKSSSGKGRIMRVEIV